MAEVSGEKYLPIGFSGKHGVGESKTTVLNAGIYIDLVISVGHLVQLVLRQAEPPALFVIARDVGDRAWMGRVGVEVRFEVLQGHRRGNRRAIV